ncbi:MAG: VCBS repeat-containing protein, partial [Vicinamibacterales bacterium]
DRLMINDGKGHLTVASDVFVGADTPGTLGLALGDLDGDGRMDVVQAQGEHPTAIQERIHLGTGLNPDTAPPSISLVTAITPPAGGRTKVSARVHDRKSPTLPAEWKRVVVEWTSAAGAQTTPMRWVGEYLWTAALPSAMAAGSTVRVCATDAAGNDACAAAVRRP